MSENANQATKATNCRVCGEPGTLELGGVPLHNLLNVTDHVFEPTPKATEATSQPIEARLRVCRTITTHAENEINHAERQEGADEIERLRALVEELRWQRDHALQCVECAEMGDGCGEIATRMLASGERSAE